MIRFMQQFHMAAVGQQMIYHIRTSLFAYMKKLPLGFRCQAARRAYEPADQ